MAPSGSQAEKKDDVPKIQKFLRVYVFLSMFSWSLTSLDEYASGGGMTFDKLFLRMLPLVMTVGYCFLGPLRKNLRGLRRPVFWPLWIYLIFGVLCGFRGAVSLLPLWKGFEIFATMVWVTAMCPDEKSLMREFREVSFLIELLMYATVVLAIINPAQGFLKSYSVIPWLNGYLPIINPNALGFLSLVVLLRHLFLPSRYKFLRLIAIGLIFLCAQSRTSYATFAVALLLNVYDGLKSRKLGRVFAATGGGVLVALFALGNFETILSIVRRGESSEEISSLSGRTDYWDVALKYADWFGGGLATGSRSLIYVAADTFYKGRVSVHNSFIEVILDAGYIGGACYIATIGVNILRQLVRVINNPRAYDGIFAACAIMFASRGMTSIVLAVYSPDFYLMILFWMYLSVSSDKKIQVLPRPVPRVRHDVSFHSDEDNSGNLTPSLPVA